MSAFTSLLSSISGQQQASPLRPSTNSARPAQGPPKSADRFRLSNSSQPVAGNAVAGVKRKSEDPEPSPRNKSAKVDAATYRTSQNGASNRPVSAGAAAAYRGTARAEARPPPTVKPALKPQSAMVSAKPTTLPRASAAPVASSSKPRGFAALLEKAKASQEASKVAVASGIKHKPKPVERISRREREKMQKEAVQEAQKAKKSGKPALADRNRPASLTEGQSSTQKKAQETSYKGTMKKAVEPLAYKGTMRAGETAQPRAKPVVKKGMGQDRYGGYASWSDLSDAEDESEEDEYDSAASSDMEGGFDDMEREETAALRAARKEDQEALAEEERHRREKLERKKKLQALNKSAAAKRRF